MDHGLMKRPGPTHSCCDGISPSTSLLRGRYLRDLTDRILALVCLIIAAPVLAAAALAVWIEDGWPVFFSHQRVGKRGVQFEVLKLRSMRASGGASLTAEGDPRITAVGGVLRKYKLDELPQLWNVVKGEMSLVGPRPEVKEFVDMNNSDWAEMLSVKPGITSATTLLLRNEEKLLAEQDDPEKFYRERLLPLKLQFQKRQMQASSFRNDLLLIGFTIYYSLFPSRFDANFVRRRFLAEEKL